MKIGHRILAAFFLALMLGGSSLGTSYYVSSSSGSDGNNGTSAATAWASLGVHVNGGAFQPGDIIYLKRGDTWNEQLIPPSSGAVGSPIQFDAYGSGPAPVITAAAPVSFVGASWTYVTGNTWKATLSSSIASPSVNVVRFGNVYGMKRTTVGSCSSVIANKYDWCVVWPTLYVYSPAGANPITTYASDGSVLPLVATPSGLQMIYVNGKSWITFQHIKVQMFDYIGVGVTGASDNLVFANMESDGMVPYGTTPHGFYVNATNPTNIQFLNDDAHLNYDGFRFDGTASAITVSNCRGYANRDSGLKDNTGAATYSYSHFYGNNIAQMLPNDVLGGIDGGGNISSLRAPAVVNFKTYPARFSFTVDDVGSAPGTEAYINSFVPLFTARGTKFNAAVVPSYPVDWTSVNQWYGLGHEIDSHSWSHQYYTTNLNPQNAPPYPNAPALDIRYTGSGTAATLTIAGNVLSTSVTGAPGDNLSADLTSAGYDTMAELEAYLASVPHYSVSYDTSGPVVRPNTHTTNLMNVAGVDIKTSAAVLVYDKTKLVPDEMTSAKNSIQANVPGLTESFFVYPDGIEDPSTEADAVAAGYSAARGSLAMKGQDNATASANSVYANGVNVQNITSLAAIQIHGMSQPDVNALAANLVFRASAWGVPYGIFTHYNSRADGTADISNTELGYLLDAVTASGGVWMTNSALASAASSGSSLGGTTRWVQNPTGLAVSLAVGSAGSPTVGRGTVTSYPVDLVGVSRPALGAWDIGASAYVSQRWGMPQYAVTVSMTGDGDGTVASVPAGIACGSACSASFRSGTSVTLSASTDDDFGGWGGTCGCSGTGTCTFHVTAACTVTADFDAASEVLSVYAGNNQTGTVSTQLKNSLAARATRDGSPVAGIAISYSDGGAGGSFSVASGTTNSNGVVSTSYTLPSAAKTVTIAATSTGYPAVTFAETATANVQVLSINGGNGQSGSAGTTLPTALSVLATVNNNPTAGVAVAFSDGGAGGTFGTPSATTNGSGIASSSYTLPGSAKSVTITASSSGYNPATFGETATGTAAGIPASLFSAGWNSISGNPPPPTWCPTDSNGAIAKVSVMRLWDSGVKWGQIETGNGTYNWNKMDAVLKSGNAYTGNVPLVANPACPMNVIYTVGGTPQWATACNGSGDPSTCLPGPTGSGFGGGAQCGMPDHWSCLPPADVNTDGTGTNAYFQSFIYTVANRYGSAIQYYELPNEADSPNFWCQAGGTVPCGGGNSSTTANTAALKRLIRVGWDMKQIVHCLNPSAKILSPAFHVGTALTWMHQFAISSINAPAGSINGCTWSAQTVTGAQTFDIVNFHGRGAGSLNSDPTQFMTAYNNAVTEANNDNLPRAYFFDDEMGYVGTDQAANKDIQAAYVAISYVLRGSVSNPPMQLAGWYQWDSNQGGLQGSIAGTAFNTVAGWLSGSTLNACTTTGTVYTCTGKTGSGAAFEILWDMGKDCDSGCTAGNQSAAAYTSWTDIAGVSHTISGGVVPVGLKPVRVQ
jgi:hypothetical protein